MGKLQNLGKAAAAALFGLALAIVLVETLPRALPGLMPRKVQAVQRIYDARSSWERMMRGDPELGFVLRPNLSLRFPSEGREIEIRTVPIPFDGVPDAGMRDIGTQPPFEVLALGDSFTFCDDAPAETCWVRLLGERLGVSIATLGVNGYSNLAEARLFDKIADRARPKLVLVGFFPNDFKDNLHFYNWTKSGTSDYWTWMRRKRRSDVSEFLARNSVFYRLFDAARRYGRRDTFEYHDQTVSFVLRADAWWRYVLERPGQTPGFRLTEQAFEAMDSRARDIGARLVVLLFPFKEQVYWRIASQVYDDLRGLSDVDMDAPFAVLRDSLTRRGIAHCDLTEGLRERSHDGPQLYLRVGAHWTDEGNHAVSELVAKCLERLGMTDGLRKPTRSGVT